MRYQPFVVLLLFLAGLVACEPGECELGGQPKPGIDFHTFVRDDVGDSLVDTQVSVRLLRIESPGFYNLVDSLASNDTLTTSLLSLPLPPRGDQVTYYLEFVGQPSSVLDTLVLHYRARPVLVSYECGFLTNFDSLRVLSHTFDSVQVLLDTVDTQNETNLRIYF
ncbi:hypothetical protein SAMN05421823_101194 [Catalinimonas alkaloidigena]|uniref:Uncharacterized protein n=1 Tax=Catalinimonas alkaloidigena TaxID=1075417 RepID=A0A1G8WXE3_9BACT|nr:DUF6452 family protein [Catalinimonas alkaloidigena]SDJ82220.1 hypothetical protein SAMN05421823_101194 [Catalinimonas alkaloidigena]